VVAGTIDPFKGQPKVGDFFAPFFTVRFLAATSTPALQAGPFGAAANKANAVLGAIADVTAEIVVSSGDTKIRFSEDKRTSQFRSTMTRLTVTNQGGGANFAEVVIEPPFEEAKNIIDNQLIQWNSVMVIEWGWVSNGSKDSIISDRHYFVIQQPKLEMHGTDVTITIVGVDMFAYSSTKREDRRSWPRSQYPTDALILAEIAKKNNFKLNFSLAPYPTLRAPLGISVPLISSPTSTVLIHRTHPIDDKEPTVVEQNEKSWVFFARLCDMNNCSFFTIGDTVYIVDQNIAKVQETSYRLIFFQQPNGPRDVPMMSFSTQALPQLFFPAESKEIKYSHHDIDQNRVVTISIDPTQMPDQVALGQRTAAGKGEADGRTVQVAAGVQTVPNPAYTSTETGKHFSVPNQQSSRDEMAKRVARNAMIVANTNAECTVPGVPHMVPQQLVRVEGVSKTFSGVYMILKVVHRLDPSGYETDLTLIRDSSTGDKATGKGERPTTGGSDPEQADGAGEATTAAVAEDEKLPQLDRGTGAE